MIRLLGVCGSRVKDGNMEALLRDSLSAAAGDDAAFEIVDLAGRKVGPCLHCNWCLKKQTDDKYCVQDDDLAEVYPLVSAADGLILASPSHFGRLSGALADFIDRQRVYVHGSVHKGKLKNKVGGAMALAFFRGGGLETTLSSINLFFMTMQMIVASSGLYQLGAGAYASRDGRGGFEKEPRHLVLEDEYGRLSAQMLVSRVIELARIVKKGTGPES